VTALLRRLLSEQGPWSELGIALLDADAHAVFSSMAPVPVDAARAGTAVGGWANWRIAAFPSSGSLDALVARDVTRYALLLVLVFGTVVVALVLAARSVSRELALSRLRTDFVASVSHELKTPLSLIRMFAESLREGWVPENKRADYYQVITRESEGLTSLINNVLNFSRIEAGTRKYRLARIDLRELLAAVLDRYRFHLKATNIDLVEDLPPDPVYACVERDAIEQVLLNLLSNAMKYMGDADRQPRQVRVSLGGGSGHVSIRVADTGIGISDEQRAHIFERFYRADDDERVRAVAGSGLGLTLAKHIVEAHDGTIAVQSVPNRGSTFEITLPLAAAGAES
jgi:signal transduction histidine kinase